MNISKINIRKILTPLIFLMIPLWSIAQVQYFEVLVNPDEVIKAIKIVENEINIE